MKKTTDFLKENINKNKHIILGCSGGPDSMCLLNLLKQNNYKIICAHINHNIRPESKDEQLFLENYCRDNNITIYAIELDTSKKHNEAYYRKKRYDFYKKLADKYQTEYIMTAHHGDDLIETILMRINRGSNLLGYSGFQKIKTKDKYTFLKPLIFYTKNEILEYNQNNNVPFVIDNSNLTDEYTRNRYRHHVLPFLKQENPTVHKKYLNFSENLIEANEYIEKQIILALKENYQNNIIDLSKFQLLDTYIQKRELETILSQIYKDDIDTINNKHITSIINCIQQTGNIKLNLPNNYIIEKCYDKIIIKSTELKSKNNSYLYILNDKITLEDGSIIEYINESDDSSNNTIRLDSKDISLPLKIRTKKPKDKIEIKNLNGSKTVKSLFIDEKVHKDIRDTYPIVTDNNDVIVWIPGLRKSKFDNEKNKKYDIILRYTQKGKD